MPKRIIRSYVETLGILSRGRFVEKCDAELARVIEALETHPDEKAKAQITVTLDVSFLQGRADIKPTVKAKLPEDKGFPGTPFWTLESGLSVEHPSQIDMFGPREADSRAGAASGAKA